LITVYLIERTLCTKEIAGKENISSLNLVYSIYHRSVTSASFKISNLKLIIVKTCVPNPDSAGSVIVGLQGPCANSTFQYLTIFDIHIQLIHIGRIKSYQFLLKMKFLFLFVNLLTLNIHKSKYALQVLTVGSCAYNFFQWPQNVGKLDPYS
jgi:hypothetical protein